MVEIEGRKVDCRDIENMWLMLTMTIPHKIGEVVKYFSCLPGDEIIRLFFVVFFCVFNLIIFN